jgi:hypothetical protein
MHQHIPVIVLEKLKIHIFIVFLFSSNKAEFGKNLGLFNILDMIFLQ